MKKNKVRPPLAVIPLNKDDVQIPVGVDITQYGVKDIMLRERWEDSRKRQLESQIINAAAIVATEANLGTGFLLSGYHIDETVVIYVTIAC